MCPKNMLLTIHKGNMRHVSTSSNISRRNKEHDLFLMIRIVIIYVLSPIAQFVLYFKRGVVCVVLFMSHLLAKDD